jgi:hypothetical protein
MVHVCVCARVRAMGMCVQHRLHFVADEIYLASDYSAALLGGAPCYVSCLTLRIRDPARFHFVWAFSKVRQVPCLGHAHGPSSSVRVGLVG